VECHAQGEPEINGLLMCVAPCRQMCEGVERLLKVAYGFAVCRPRQGLAPCLSTVCQGFVPHLATQGVVGQTVYLLRQLVWRKRFENLDKADV
jgi:hypothetical protein